MLASTISGFATLTLTDQEQLSGRDQKAICDDRTAKGLIEKAVLYGHVFRNAMLIVIAGFPRCLSEFSLASLIIETIFSLDGLGRLGFEAAVARDYPVIFGTLFIFGLVLVVGIFGSDVCACRSAHRL